ncbi:GGDEF domain-containing protein [Vibrio mangrovi]|nr:sensor domain-containing diguanylate cyclase [Vibrio mangrovi]MDW6002682.1 sensor domain-containing diguanylate cyclase [Vibrio mangrovi]
MVFLWLGLAVIPFGYYLHLSYEAHQFFIRQLETQSKQYLEHVDAKATLLSTRIQQNFSQLSQSPLLRDFAITGNPVYRDYLKNQWYLTAANVKFFYQLRYLNKQGKEIIRIDYTPQMSHPYIVPDNALQNKGKRDYFYYAQRLASGEQGYFGIDLEREFGQLVIPYKPGFRMIYPIDNQQQRLGYFIANLEVLRLIQEITSNDLGYSIDFIDQSGYYILSDNKEKLFGRLVKERENYNLAYENPKLWEYIHQASKQSGSYQTPEGLYVFQPFQASLFGNGHDMTLLAMYPQSLITHGFAQRDREIRTAATTLFLFFGIIAGVFALLWEAYLRNRLEQTFNQVVLDNSVAVALTNAQHIILRANVRFCELFSTEQSELQGKNILDLQPSKAQYHNILKHLRTTGEWQGQVHIGENDPPHVCKVEVRALEGTVRKISHYVYSFSDISEHYNAILELKERNDRDLLTALWNKKKFSQTLLHYSRLQERYGDQPKSSLAIIDIDNFKRINDTYGHAIGDQVLLRLANQLLSILRDTDFVSRIGGDEFAVIIQHADVKTSQKLMVRICHAIESWHEYDTTVSIGIAEITSSHNQSFVNADKALYRSKRKGKNCVSAHGIEQLTVVQNNQSQ